MKVIKYGETVDLSFKHKTQCPRCASKGNDRSKDNLHIFGLDGDGGHLGARCFGCGYKIPSTKWLEENAPIELTDMEYEMSGTDFNDEVYNNLKSITTFNSKNYRGIKPEISKYFGTRYECSQQTGEIVASYYPVTKGATTGIPIADSLVGFKIRKHPKSFSCIGEVSKECDLFGQWRFPTHKGTVVIAGGEIDQMSLYMVLKDDYDKRGNKRYDEVAVVSPTNGEGSVGQLKNHYTYFSQYNKIILCFDNDAAGRIATEAAAQVLPRGKVFIMPLRNKDVNEYIVKGMEKELISDFWASKPYTLDGIKSSVEGFNEIEDELLKERISLPAYMNKMQQMMGGGIMQGRIVNIIAATSSGKSTHVEKMTHHWIFNTELVPTIVTLEKTAAQYNLDMLQNHLKENFMFGKSGREIVDLLEGEKYKSAMAELSYREDGSPRYFLIDERSGDIKSIEDKMEEMFKKFDSRLFVIDVLSDLLRGSTAELAEDHMNFQKRLVKEGATIINVLHTIKIPLDKDGKQRDVTEYDALGTGSFVQSAAINILLNRDKMEGDSILQNTTRVGMPKCRGGKTGEAGEWFFDFNSHSCYDIEHYKNKNPHLFTEEDL